MGELDEEHADGAAADDADPFAGLHVGERDRVEGGGERLGEDARPPGHALGQRIERGEGNVGIVGEGAEMGRAVRAEELLALAAVVADAAGDARADGDELADGGRRDALAELLDDADALVAEDDRRLPELEIAMDGMDVRAADAARQHADDGPPRLRRADHLRLDPKVGAAVPDAGEAPALLGHVFLSRLMRPLRAA